MVPSWSTFGWKQGVVNLTNGGLWGYVLGNCNDSLYSFPSYTYNIDNRHQNIIYTSMQYRAGYNWLLTVYTVKCCINLYTSLLSTCMPKEWKHFFNSLMSLCINVKIIFMYWGSLNFWPVLFICRPCTFTGKLLKEQILQSCWEKYYESFYRSLSTTDCTDPLHRVF